MRVDEIIKAFEEHYRQVDAGYSTHLEYGGKGDEHEEKYIYMLRDVLDLIVCQKAEIEELRKSVTAAEAQALTYKLQFAEADTKCRILKALAELGEIRARDYRAMRDRALKAEAEVDRLTGMRNADPMDFCGVLCRYSEELIEKGKTEAIEECLNWVLSLFPEDKNFTTISRYTIKRKLKEMTGDAKC